jgi:hypothetical protein
MRYAVVIEKADGNYSAYVPDLPAQRPPALAPSIHAHAREGASRSRIKMLASHFLVASMCRLTHK